MKKDPLIFIALLPDEALQQEVTGFKKYIANTWGSSHALKSPPHLTLQPPFAWPESDLDRLKDCLARFASRQSSFPVELNGFGAFSPRVVFVRPVKNAGLERLFQQLTQALRDDLEFSDPRNDRPFHPHMTIAHRDLSEDDFPAVWAHFRNEKLERRFTAAALTLLRSVQGKWVAEAEFTFGH